MRSRLLLALLGALGMTLLGSSPARSELVAPALHIDLERRPSYLVGPLVAGYVTNDSDYRLTNVRLRVDATDAGGHPLPPTFGWVAGDVPAHGRAWFRVATPPNATSLSVSVTGFDLVTVQSP